MELILADQYTAWATEGYPPEGFPSAPAEFMGKSPPPNCWIDVFELSRYRGRRRRIFGPAHFVAIRSRAAAWGIGLDSIVVGSEAYVRLYDSLEPTQTALWILPRQHIEDLMEFQVTDEVDSIQLRDRAPIEGEPGYDAFIAIIEKTKKARE